MRRLWIATGLIVCLLLGLSAPVTAHAIDDNWSVLLDKSARLSFTEVQAQRSRFQPMDRQAFTLPASPQAIWLKVDIPALASPHWLWLTAFVGANLLQYSLSNFCPLALLLKKLGLPEQTACLQK